MSPRSTSWRARPRARRAVIIGVLAAGAAGAAAVAVAQGRAGMTAEEASETLHPYVLADVKRRTGDGAAGVGHLDCVQFSAREGSCLADLATDTKRSEGLLIAVRYEVSDGDLIYHLRVP